MSLKVTKICDGSFCVKVPDIGVSWLFNAWPDVIKHVIDKNHEINGMFYTEQTQKTNILPESNFLEFPLLHCLFNMGMIFEGKRPVVIGNELQINRAREAFLRGLYGFQNVEEIVECSIKDEEAEALLNEIEGLGFNGIQDVDDLVHFLPLTAEKNGISCVYKGLEIASHSPNVFELKFENERLSVDCNLSPQEYYNVPFKLKHDFIEPAEFQIIHTGEADGFSPKHSCSHTVIRWHGKTLCVDLPMNASEILFHAGISNSEIDAVVFTHNHDDHIGDFGFLFESSKKIDVLCPEIIWKAIVRKVAALFDCSEREICSYVRYIPLAFGEEYDYKKLIIKPQLSIHPVPTAIYSFSVEWKNTIKSYVHLCDVLNFERCNYLVETGSLGKDRFSSYKQFMLQRASLKKIDVGTKDGGELFSVHGSWRDFLDDSSDEIVLTHVNPEMLDPTAIDAVGEISKFGSARNLIDGSSGFLDDFYKEKIRSYLRKTLSYVLGRDIKENELGGFAQWYDLIDAKVVGFSPGELVWDYSNNSDSILLWLTGCGNLILDRNVVTSKIQPGDMVGDIEAILELGISYDVRTKNFSRVAYISKDSYRKLITDVLDGLDIKFLEKLRKQHQIKEILTDCGFYPSNVSMNLQDLVAARAQKIELLPGELIPDGLCIGCDGKDYIIQINDKVLDINSVMSPVFGSLLHLIDSQEKFKVEIIRPTTAVFLAMENVKWLMDCPLIRYRLHQIVRWRKNHLCLMKNKSI